MKSAVDVPPGEKVVQVQEPSAPEHLVDIAHERTCDCPISHISCIDAKSWLKSQLGVWQFNYNGRDIRDKSLHPATYPIGSLAYWWSLG